MNYSKNSSIPRTWP